MLGRWASNGGPCYAITALVIAAVLYPLSYDKRTDSFPLSSYPMFARFHREPTLVTSYLIAVGDDFRRSVPPEMVANAEVLQAQATIRSAIRRGNQGMKALCERVAAAVAGDAAFGGAREVRLVRGRFDAIKYLTGEDTKGSETVRIRCRVPR